MVFHENFLLANDSHEISYLIFSKIRKDIATIWAATRENLSSGDANNTGADQPAHPRSLISAYVIRVLESIICKLSTGEISFF